MTGAQLGSKLCCQCGEEVDDTKSPPARTCTHWGSPLIRVYSDPDELDIIRHMAARVVHSDDAAALVYYINNRSPLRSQAHWRDWRCEIHRIAGHGDYACDECKKHASDPRDTLLELKHLVTRVGAATEAEFDAALDKAIRLAEKSIPKDDGK